MRNKHNLMFPLRLSTSKASAAKCNTKHFPQSDRFSALLCFRLPKLSDHAKIIGACRDRILLRPKTTPLLRNDRASSKLAIYNPDVYDWNPITGSRRAQPQVKRIEISNPPARTLLHGPRTQQHPWQKNCSSGRLLVWLGPNYIK